VPFYLALGILVAALYAYGWARIFARAGYPPFMGFLMLVPVANVILFITLAFGRWPLADYIEQLEHERRLEGGGEG
jgi:hypothetical protein